MNNPESSIETLLEKMENYGKTTQELIMLQSVDKFADVVSSLIARLAVLFIAILSLVIINIGVALWLGNILGDNYLGFFIIGGFYILIAVLFHNYRNEWLKYPMGNSIIKQMMKQKSA